MKIVYTTGCVDYSLTIDGEEFLGLPEEEQKQALRNALEQVDDAFFRQELLMLIAEHCGEWAVVCHWEKCGDDVEEFKMEV